MTKQALYILFIVIIFFSIGCTNINVESNKCNADNLIPDKITLYTVTDSDEIPKEFNHFGDNFWKDNTPMNVGAICNTKFNTGSETGENINYYYLRQSDYAGCPEKGLRYFKQNVNADGLIEGNLTFGIIPVLEIISDETSIDPFGFGYYITQNFTIISYSVTDCSSK